MSSTERRSLIYGSRPDGHARVVAELFGVGHGVRFEGLIDDVPGHTERAIRELRVLGTASDLAQLRARGLSAIVLGFGSGRGRIEVLRRIDAAGLSMPTLIHGSATVAASATIGDGAQVLPGAVIGPGARIGRGALINSGTIVEHDCVLHDAAVVYSGAVLAGRVVVGSEAEIGAGATVVPDVTIGAGSRIGAGAVVIEDVAPAATVVGVPARAR